MRLCKAMSKAATAPALGPISSGQRFRHASRPETGGDATVDAAHLQVRATIRSDLSGIASGVSGPDPGSPETPGRFTARSCPTSVGSRRQFQSLEWNSQSWA